MGHRRRAAGRIRAVGANQLVGIYGPERYRWLREHFSPIGHVAYSTSSLVPPDAASGDGATLTAMLAIRPLTPPRWKDLEALFGDVARAAAVVHVLAPALARCSSGRRQRQPPGLRKLGAEGRSPRPHRLEGRRRWDGARYAPRAAIPRWRGPASSGPLTASPPVWSVSCLFVARPSGSGEVSTRLLEAAADYAPPARRWDRRGLSGRAARQGGRTRSSGPASRPRFAGAGFQEVARRSKTRPS